MRLAGTALVWGGTAVVVLVALRLVMKLLGLLFGAASFLLFTVLPLVVVGWLLVKLVRSLNRKPEPEA